MKVILKDFRFCFAMLVFNIIYTIVFAGEFNLKASSDIYIVAMSFIYISSVIVIYNSKEKEVENLYRYLAVGLAALEIITLIYTYSIYKFIYNDVKALIFTRLFYVKSLFEPIVMILVLKNYKKTVSNKSLLCITSALILASVCILKLINFSIIELLNNPVGNIIAQIVEMTLYLYIFTLIMNMKKDIDYYSFKDFNYYVLLMLMTKLLTFFEYGVKELWLVMISTMISEIGRYFLIKIMLVEVIKLPRQTLYRNLNEKTKELEDTTKILENMYKTNAELIRNLPCGLAMIDEVKVTYVNEAVMNLFHLKDKSEIIGKTIYDLCDEEYHSIIKRKIEDKVNGLCGKYHNYKCNFNNIQVYGEIICLKLDNLCSDKFICLFCDMTEKRRLESIEELLKKKDREEKLKNDFLTNLSHEFKTPVNVIYSAVQIQRLKEDAGQFEEILKYNDVIKQNCNRLTRLINNFIDTTRLTVANTKANLNPINIVEFIENITMSVVAFAEDKGIEVIFDTNEEEIIAEVDNSLIDRAVLNIISNAIKYNKKNGHINVVIEGKEKSVAIIIEDNGIGISKEKKATIFNRFERENRSKSSSRQREGSGLGLNIVKEIVKLHNGNISLESEENVGTKVTIEIPRCDSDLQNHDREFYAQDYDNMRYNLELEMSDLSL